MRDEHGSPVQLPDHTRIQLVAVAPAVIAVAGAFRVAWAAR